MKTTLTNNDTRWDAYSNKVQMLIEKPKNYGTISREDAEGLNGELFVYEYGSEAIGDKITLCWIVNPDNESILMCAYEYFGAPAGIAANDMLALLTRNKKIHEIEELSYKNLEYFLRDNPNTPALPQSKQYTIMFALDAAKQSANMYLNGKTEESHSTQVSSDTPMSQASIIETIRLHDIRDLETLAHYTKAGKSDTNSLHTLESLIKTTQEKIAAEKEAKKETLDIPFVEMTTEQQINTIDGIIDENIRQFLIMDGGNMEVLDVKINGGNIDIYIRYTGACSGCASANTSTLFAIETTLKEKLGDAVRVLPI